MSTWQAHGDHTATSPRSKPPTSQSIENDAIPRMAQSPNSLDLKSHVSNDFLRKPSSVNPAEAVSSPAAEQSDAETSKISAYARLDFENYTFFVQTLQVVLGRKAVEDASLSHHSVDVHLSSKKAISRRHAKIFYNFGTQRFEISILGRNGAFVDNSFVETGITVPLVDNTKIQIGDIPFTFVLPSLEPIEADEKKSSTATPFNPSDAINLRSNLYSNPASPNKKKPLSEEQKRARRDSKANLVRRLSNARRKSLASSTTEEITALLKELEDIGDEEEIDSIDKEVNELLRQGNLEKEEDEIDELVKQHNLSQGVVLEDANKHDDVDMSVLDQEIASLAPLIEGRSGDKDINIYDNKQGVLGRHGSIPPPADSAEQRAPLMGRPVGPRMGKPAQIQPPANRAYGRQPVGQMYGVPATGTYPTGYGSPYGTAPSYAASGRPGMYHPMMMPTRPPPPKIEVNVEVIDSVPVKSVFMPFKAISTGIGVFERAPVCVSKALEAPSVKPKIPLSRKDAPSAKKPKSAASKDVPEQYKSKPAISVSAMIANVLRGPNPRKSGFTIAEILDAIREFYPYYQYCPDGWQAGITHVLKTHKMFKREFKAGLDSEHLWVVDEEFLAEKEKVRKKQQEVAMAKAKEAALKAVELRSKQPTTQYASVGRPFMTPYTSSFSQPRYATSPGQTLMQGSSPSEKPKSIAELASQIKRDSPAVSMPSSYSQPSSTVHSSSTPLEASSNIKDQLAANRSSSPPQTASLVSPANRAATPQPVATASAVSSAASSSTVSKQLPMNAETKQSLAYLQKELFTLYKARKLSYNTATTTSIITKALATTIAQVNTIGAKAGCGDNALNFLVEKAPQQVSKILDIALTKSIKELDGKGSNAPSREATPGSSTPAPAKIVKTEADTGSRPATPSSSAAPPKPSYSGGLSRPHFSGTPRPQPNSKPGALSNGPSFLSNKPRPEKRPAEDTNAESSKSIKLE